MNQNQRATAARVIHDEHDVFKEAGQATCLNVIYALEAECQSLIIAMQQVWIKGYRKVTFEGDCKNLVHILEGITMKFDVLN
ncbi:unnamed protein product [Arabidopsis halleri]